ncbi:hypothetical protein [Rhizobium binxianense]|jgi:hypothetical protein
MTQNEIHSVENNDPADLERLDDRDDARRGYDVEIHLPARIDRTFLAAALLHAIDNKVAFAVFHEKNKIVIGYDPADEDYMPSRWSDRRWHIGREDRDPGFFPDDD